MCPACERRRMFGPAGATTTATIKKDNSAAARRGILAGIAILFGCDDADELHAHLCARDVRIAFPPKDGPFGRYFAFVDPFGYTITAHTAQQSN